VSRDFSGEREKDFTFRKEPIIYAGNIALPPNAESPFDSKICDVAKIPEDF